LKRFFYSQSKNPLSQSPACLLNINEIKIAYLLLYRNRRLKLPSFQSDFSIFNLKYHLAIAKLFLKDYFCRISVKRRLYFRIGVFFAMLNLSLIKI
jgi:predicted DNA-binding transcriptional regulator